MVYFVRSLVSSLCMYLCGCISLVCLAVFPACSYAVFVFSYFASSSVSSFCPYVCLCFFSVLDALCSY